MDRGDGPSARNVVSRGTKSLVFDVTITMTVLMRQGVGLEKTVSSIFYVQLSVAL